MLNSFEMIFRQFAYRRACRAISRAENASWYMGQLLRNRLDLGLASPAEVMQTVGAWKTTAKQAATAQSK